MPDTNANADADDNAQDGPDETSTDETLTLEFEVSLDDVHAPAWARVLAAAPDAETARRTIASRVEFAVGPEEALYRQFRLVEQQRQQAKAQMAERAGGIVDDTDTGTDIDTEGD